MLKKRVAKTVFMSSILFALLSFAAQSAKAQNVSLSISPPIVEVVTKPEEKIEQTYLLKNEGADNVISVSIFPFNQADELGNPRLSRSLEDYDPLNIKYWFTIIEPQIPLGGKFTIKQGEEKKIVISIKPPIDAEDGDYYFTIIFKTELENIFVLPESKSTISQAEIGSNILITVSKDGTINRKAAIKEFGAPKIIDSFSPLTYQVKLANIGKGFFKPLGKITVESVLGKKYVLNLAPQNIISASSRQISCIENEKLVPCRLPLKFLLGPYKATLSFEIEGDKKPYSKTISSFGLPVIPISGFIILTFIVILAKNRKRLLTKKIDKSSIKVRDN
jgi:hypothetical protein